MVGPILQLFGLPNDILHFDYFKRSETLLLTVRGYEMRLSCSCLHSYFPDILIMRCDWLSCERVIFRDARAIIMKTHEEKLIHMACVHRSLLAGFDRLT